jgi:N6-adenosine-specific RNA methylase IME4
MCKDGITPWMGMGEFLRNSHELLLVGRSGKAMRNDKGVRSAVLTQPLFGNGRKPEQFYDLIERLVSGPYLELFATKRRDGWFAYGNQVPSGSDVSIPEWDLLQENK